MRIRSVLFPAALLVFTGLAPATAENRTFIVANSPDGYGVDYCLANSHACGAAAAAAYCQSKEFTAAASFRKIARVEITGVVPTSGNCGRNGCEEFVAIECTR